MMGTDWNLVWSYIPVPVKKVFDLRSQKNQLPHHQKELPLSLRHRWHKYNNAFAKTESRSPRRFLSMNALGTLCPLPSAVILVRKPNSEMAQSFGTGMADVQC